LEEPSRDGIGSAQVSEEEGDTMRRRLAVAVLFASTISLAMSAATTSSTASAGARLGVGWGDRCTLWSVTEGYLYGPPTTFLGSRDDDDEWEFNMSLNDCVSNLAQVRVKQWGAEVCSQMNAEYVILRWIWNYWPGGGNVQYGSVVQQYDCNDLP
jgi:hypothetical protein